MTKVKIVPKDCSFENDYNQAIYKDCFSQKLSADDHRIPAALFVSMMHPAPHWVRLLMRLRNWVVGFFGLKSGTGTEETVMKDPASFLAGDFIDFFKIESLSETEIVVSANDSHLNSRFSLLIETKAQGKAVYFTSVVTTNNWFGNAYMFVIASFHRLIVPQFLKKLA